MYDIFIFVAPVSQHFHTPKLRAAQTYLSGIFAGLDSMEYPLRLCRAAL